MRIEVEPGVRLEVLDTQGPTPDAPTLVMLHGFAGAPLDFEVLASACGATHRVVRFWHRGHGPSSRPEAMEAYALDRLAADALAVADALHIEQFDLLGWSLGGMVARRLVLGSPARVRSLVLVDTSPGPIPSFDPAVMDAGADLAVNDGLGALKALLDELDPLDNEAYERLLIERPGYREILDGKFWAMSPESWAALARAIAHQGDDSERLASIDVPALVVVGELDEPFLAPSKAIAAAIPNAQLLVVPDAGHSPLFENPAVFVPAVTEFIRSPLGANA